MSLMKVSDLTQLSLEVLQEKCAEESNRFFRDEANDEQFCYELFRRAITDKDELAWQYVYEQYEWLVRGWVLQKSSFQSLDNRLEDIVQRTFCRFWQSFTAEKFERCNTLAEILRYLQMCVSSTVNDQLRRAKDERVLRPLEALIDESSQETVETRIIRAATRREFWNELRRHLKDEHEVFLVSCYFVEGMKPGEIHRRYPDVFPDVNDIYRLKRNILNRLGRTESLKKWLVRLY